MEDPKRIKILAIRLTVFIGIFLMAIKFSAYFITSSVAILTDAMESIINVAAGIFAWYSIYLSSKPKDKEHPYGHGKIEFISAGFEGGLIMMAACYILYKAFRTFIEPHSIESLDMGIYLTSGAGLINFFLGTYLIKTGKKQHSPTLVADGKHLLTDTYSSLGLVIGLVLVYFTHLMWLDALISVALGLGILYTGYQLIRSSIAGLMDEADIEMLENVAKVLEENRKENWIDMHNLRMVKYGAHVHIDSHLTLPWYYSLEESHAEVTAVESLISEKFHSEVELFIHADPCLESSCGICNMSNCKERKSSFIKKINWNTELLLLNQKHRI
ncbi:MAG: cation diffusion facilitator family transporter [Bacteroidia bacterium]